MKTLLIAHRGDTINFPENTLEAFQSALEKGAHGIELDLQFHNKELIIVHNYLYDTTKTYPLLSDVLQQFSTKGRIEIEVKSLDLDFLSPLKSLLEEYKNADLEITTSIFPLVSYLRTEFPEIPIGVIFHEKEFEAWMTKAFIIRKIVKMMKLFKAQKAHIPTKFLDKEMIEACHVNAFAVHGHIHKKPIDEQVTIYKKFEELGVDQCTFDDIDLLNMIK